MRFPFEASWSEVEADLGSFVDAVFSCLESEFLVLPKGAGFVEYPVFEQGYEALRVGTGGFERLNPGEVLTIVRAKPVALLVLRAMLGFTPPEWAYLATQRSGVDVSQGAVRSLDRKVRLAPLAPLGQGGLTTERVKALVTVACQLLAEGMPATPADRLHRLDKADTRGGPAALRSRATVGVPYAMLLYERFLGRPFAGHRDSVSELVGDALESAIDGVLHRSGVSFRRTKRAERVEGFDQAPDFIVPDEFNPQVVIEAKLTEDDGTARDKVTRVQHLGELAAAGMPPGQRRFEVIACIAGRGFGVRRKDMEKLLQATQGKVFTLQNLDRLVECTRLKDYWWR
ncbi:MAG: hypothetical protein AB2L07_02880 [Thermoanaerobaculaceae bacterium]